MMASSEPPAISDENLANLDNHSDDKIKILNLLFHECCIDPNTKREDETFLQMSLRTRQPDAFILRLMKMDCDVNVTNRYGSTPLHTAIKRPTVVIAKELLERGANVNAQDTNQFTPLHYAVMKNHEAVCMLLYYGADVNIMCCHNMLPLNVALFSKEFDSAETLMNYYDDQGLFEDFNLFLDDYCKALEHLLSSDNPDLFKLVWSRIDHYALTELQIPFLVHYLSECSYSLPQWVECLELILQSKAAVDLIEHFNDYVHRTYRYTFTSMLLYTFCRRKVSLRNRISILYLTLSLGSEVYINDVNSIYSLYGFGDELEAFIFAADYKRSLQATYSSDTFIFMPLSFIFALGEDFSVVTLLHLFEKQIKSRLQMDEAMKQNYTISISKFFSLPSAAKTELLRLCQRHLPSCNSFDKKVEMLPEFPSLLELSRNQIYKSIKSVHKVETACEFHAAVKRLELPQKLRDIVRFKVPPY